MTLMQHHSLENNEKIELIQRILNNQSSLSFFEFNFTN